MTITDNKETDKLEHSMEEFLSELFSLLDDNIPESKEKEEIFQRIEAFIDGAELSMYIGNAAITRLIAEIGYDEASELLNQWSSDYAAMMLRMKGEKPHVEVGLSRDIPNKMFS